MNNWSRHHFFPDTFEPIKPRKVMDLPTQIEVIERDFEVPVSTNGFFYIFWCPLARLQDVSRQLNKPFVANLRGETVSMSTDIIDYKPTAAKYDSYTFSSNISGRCLSAYMDIEYYGPDTDLGGLIRAGYDIITSDVSDTTETAPELKLSDIPAYMFTRTYSCHERPRLIYNINDSRFFDFSPYPKRLFFPFFLVHGIALGSGTIVKVRIKEVFEMLDRPDGVNSILGASKVGNDAIGEYIETIQTMQVPNVLTTIEEYQQLVKPIMPPNVKPSTNLPYAWAMHHFFPLSFPPAKIPDKKFSKTSIFQFKKQLELSGNFCVFFDPIAIPYCIVSGESNKDWYWRTSLASDFISTGQVFSITDVKLPTAPKIRLLSAILEIKYSGPYNNEEGIIDVSEGFFPASFKADLEDATNVVVDTVTKSKRLWAAEALTNVLMSKNYAVKDTKTIYVIFNLCDKSHTAFFPRTIETPRQIFALLNQANSSKLSYQVNLTANLELVQSINNQESIISATQEPPGIDAFEQIEKIRSILKTSKTSILDDDDYQMLKNKLISEL